MKKHCLHVVMIAPEFPPLTIGGISTHLGHLVRGFQRNVERVDVFVYSRDHRRDIRDGNARIHFCSPRLSGFPLFGRPYILWRAQYLTDSVLEFVRKNRFEVDIIHCHEWYEFIAGSKIAAALRVPIVTSMHQTALAPEFWGESPTLFDVEHERQMCLGSHGVIAVSESVRNIVVDRYGALPGVVAVIRNGISCGYWKSTRKRRAIAGRQFELDLGSKLIVFAGRFVPEKGLIDFLRAAEIVLSEHPEVIYAIAGEYKTLHPYATEIIRYCQSKDILKKGIKFLGRLDQEELRNLYSVATLAVVPSLYESFPYVALEAMAMKVPVVTSRIGGLAEIVRHGYSGFSIPIVRGPLGAVGCNADQLARAQVQLLNDPRLRKRFARNGRQEVETHFRVDQMVRRTAEFYQIVRDRFLTHGATGLRQGN